MSETLQETPVQHSNSSEASREEHPFVESPEESQKLNFFSDKETFTVDPARQTRKIGPMYSHIWHYIGPMYSQSCQRWANFPGLSGVFKKVNDRVIKFGNDVSEHRRVSITKQPDFRLQRVFAAKGGHIE